MKQKILHRKQPSPAMKRKWITLYYEKKVSIKSIADDDNYPTWTVGRVITKMDPNRKERSDKGKTKTSATLDLPDFDKLTMDGESAETQVEMFITSLLGAVRQTKKLKASQAIMYVNQLMNALKRLRSVQFGSIAKNLDVKIVEGIIRKYEPHATDLRVIEIYREESDRVRKT